MCVCMCVCVSVMGRWVCRGEILRSGVVSEQKVLEEKPQRHLSNLYEIYQVHENMI